MLARQLYCTGLNYVKLFRLFRPLKIWITKIIRFTVWDVGGDEKIRPLQRHYFNGTQGLIYVIDSNDPPRLDRVREELNYMLDCEELRDCPVLVFANKQDLPEAVSPDEVTSALGMTSLDSRPWHIQGASAVTGAGVYEGLDWLASNYKARELIINFFDKFNGT
ncbi:ADP-ribosylation factor [Armadillidium vulgare]|nr:ADP-ribosylation factor [Armadillidium vulgare]